jgi:hypothetical protein
MRRRSADLAHPLPLRTPALAEKAGFPFLAALRACNYCCSIRSTTCKSLHQASEDLHQIWRFGGNWLR